MAEIQKRWISHLRNDSHQESADRSLSCPLCSADIQPDFDAFRAHVLADEPKHKTLTADADIEEAFRKMSIHAHKQRSASPISHYLVSSSLTQTWEYFAQFRSNESIAEPPEAGCLTSLR